MIARPCLWAIASAPSGSKRRNRTRIACRIHRAIRAQDWQVQAGTDIASDSARGGAIIQKQQAALGHFVENRLQGCGVLSTLPPM